LLETAGATRVTMDLHADQIQGFFENQLITFCLNYLLPYVKSLGLDNLTLLPDMGGSKERTLILNFRIRCSYLLQEKKQTLLAPWN
jgi:phosphoribosylpyrophosphate synthetase